MNLLSAKALGLHNARGDMTGALITGLTVLPSCIAAGVIAYSPLGAQFAASGIAAAFTALIIGGICVAILSSSSFVINSPLASIAVLQASFIAEILLHPDFQARPDLTLIALSACIVVAGLMVIIIGASGFASILKYTPYPVLAGFRNGIIASQLWQQLKPYIDLSLLNHGPIPFLNHPQQLAIVLGLAAAIYGFDRFVKALPAPFLGILLGTVIFYGAQHFMPSLEVGKAVGTINFNLPPQLPLLALTDPSARDTLLLATREIFQMSLVLAMLVTLQSLPVFRLVKDQIDTPLSPSRNVIALGIGNCVSGLLGGLVIAAAGSQGNTAYRNGGRTRWVGIFLGLAYLLIALLAPAALALVPLIAVSAVVVQNSTQGVDAWTVGLFRQVIRNRVEDNIRRARSDLLIALVVTFATVGLSALVGLGLGVILACLVFIIEMSRPLVKRRLTGAEVASKRIRASSEASYLREAGASRLSMELHGVLFFGNTEILSDEILKEAATADYVLLDLRGVTGMDASGEAILKSLAERMKKMKKQLLFCNLPGSVASKLKAISAEAGMPAPFPDFDSALEWMEERSLAKIGRTAHEMIVLQDHDVLRGLEPSEISFLSEVLTRVSFPAGSNLCEQGDPGDKMWLLSKGSVSVRLKTNDSRGSRRLASLAQGTSVGEMAIIEDKVRSATLVADEDVSAFELTRDNYERLLSQHPTVATKLLSNLLRALAGRIRDNHSELRDSVT